MITQSNKIIPSFQTQRTWRHVVKSLPGVQSVIDLNVAIEDLWFDVYYNVDTAPELSYQDSQGWRDDKINFHYLPIRPKCARRVLRRLPVKDRNEYTFIDFGSGKGRAILVAAGRGFRRLCGIELRKELHDQACKNFDQCRNLPACSMESVNTDACEYDFPNEKLVLFFFNPFGSNVMAKVLNKLSESLDKSFRDVWVVLHESTCAYVVDKTPQLRLQIAQNGYSIYRSIR